MTTDRILAHFHEHQVRAIAHDEIEFAHLAAEIAFHQLQAVQPQVVERSIFAALALDLLAGLGHGAPAYCPAGSGTPFL